jgi:hypothetical protein
MQRAVSPTGNCDVLSAEHPRVALHDGRGIDFCELVELVVTELIAVHFAAQLAQISFSRFHA